MGMTPIHLRQPLVKPLCMSGNQKQVKPVWPYVVEASVEEAAMEKVQGGQVTFMRLLVILTVFSQTLWTLR